MIGRTLLAAALLAGGPAYAAGPADRQAGQETRIPRMASFLDWVADGSRGLYIRADTGRWYYAAVQPNCPRLHANIALSFQTAPNGDLDRYSAIRAEGWRCQIASVTASEGPPGRRRR